MLNTLKKEKSAHEHSLSLENWLRGLDLNQRPSGYEPDELPSCSTPRPYCVTVKHSESFEIGCGSWI